MATIKDIAKAANVSVATVSNVVNKNKYVSPDLVERVNAAIMSCDHLPNFIVRKTSPIPAVHGKYVALVTSGSFTRLDQAIKDSVLSRLSESDYELVPIEHYETGNNLNFLYQSILVSENISGVIVLRHQSDLIMRDFLSHLSKPIVVIDFQSGGNPYDTVFSDNEEGAWKAAGHLIRSGHNRIAILLDDMNRADNTGRIRGYRKALQEYGIPPDDLPVREGLRSKEDVEAAIRTLLNSNYPPTAVLAGSQAILIELLRQIKSRGLNCPKDISVIGFDASDWAEVHSPSISALNQDPDRIGRAAAELLTGKLSGVSSFGPKQVRVPTKFHIRSSTAGIGRGPFGEPGASADDLRLTEPEKAKIRTGNHTAVISFHYTGRAFMRLVEQGMRNVFDALNISLIAVTDAHFDPGMQATQLESLLSMKPDIITSMTSDSTRMSEIYHKIAKSDTKLVFIGSGIPKDFTPDDYVTSISGDERSVGQCIGNAIGEYMYRKNQQYAGFIIHGCDSFYISRQRDTTVRRTLEDEYPNITIVDTVTFEKEDTYDATVSIMTRYPEIEMLYVAWERPALNALKALNDIGRTDVSIVTMDLDFEVAMNLAQGGQIKAICGQRPFEIGQSLAYAGACSLIGKKVPSFISHPPMIITCENLLKSWREIFLEPAPKQLVDQIEVNGKTAQ